MTYSPHYIALETYVGRAAAREHACDLALKAESWLLSAGRRIGKTMFLRHVALDVDTPTVWVYIDKQELPEISAAATFFGHLIAATWRQITSADSQPSPATIQDLAGLVADIGAEGRNWCLLLDEADSLVQQAWGASALENLRWLVSNSPSARFASIGLAGGMNLVSRVRSAGSSISNVCTPLALPALSDTDLTSLISLGFPKPKGDLVGAVRSYAGGHPFLAQLFLATVESSEWPLLPAEQTILEEELGRRAAAWLGDLHAPARDELLRAAMGGGQIIDEQDELIRSGFARSRGTSTVLISPAMRRAVLASGAVAGVTSQEPGGAVLPGHPYSNKRVFRRILESARVDIRWLDNHAGFDMLDLLADAELQPISVRILGGEDEPQLVRLPARFRDLRRELELKGTTIAWRRAHPGDLRLSHDRYLIVDDISYNIPPASSAVRERRSDVTAGTLSAPEFDAMWARAIPIG